MTDKMITHPEIEGLVPSKATHACLTKTGKVYKFHHTDKNGVLWYWSEFDEWNVSSYDNLKSVPKYGVMKL